MTTVLIVDDQPTTRRGLRLLLEVESDLKVIGEAGDGKEALDMAMRLNPDVILMDVHMNNMDGITTVMALQVAAPQIPVVMHSLDDTPDVRQRALAAGAAVFVGKNPSAKDLLTGIRDAVAGAQRRQGRG